MESVLEAEDRQYLAPEMLLDPSNPGNDPYYQTLRSLRALAVSNVAAARSHFACATLSIALLTAQNAVHHVAEPERRDAKRRSGDRRRTQSLAGLHRHKHSRNHAG